jgi:hypothetical protein
MKLLRIGVGNFRSIGEKPVMIDFQKRINLFIGANNAGKSNVLEILGRLKKLDLARHDLNEIDRHRRDAGRQLVLTYEVERTDEKEFPDATATLQLNTSSDSSKTTPFELLDYHSFTPFMLHWMNIRFNSLPSDEQLRDEKRDAAGIAFEKAHRFIPELHTIPQFRQIVPGDYNLNGSGIVDLLAHWKSPDIGEDANRTRFDKLVEFLRELLGMEDITLDVTRKSTELVVERTGLRLPLKHYGTGIHQLIILAIAVLAHEKAWIAIEEPEIHLHPLLQKAFLRFLIDKTNNNYLLTTHSNAFLSRPQDSHIVHLWLEDGETKNRVVETTSHILDVLNDLGIRAADILQANFVIWVEGPSDRIYLNHWLKIQAADLVEGIDYSIMFYGGRLLSHLSMEREDGDLTTDELIKLLRINQHSAILIDSDCKNGSDSLNATKSRIKKECKSTGVMCWVTEGREVENYVPPESFAAAYKEVTNADRTFKVGKFQKIDPLLKKVYRTVWREGFAYEKDKVGFARRVIRYMPEVTERLGLRDQIKELVSQIRAAR